MTAQEIKDANKELDAKIKKGDSSAVQQKTDLNDAFDKTPQGQVAKKEADMEKKKDELAIAEKEADAMRDKEVDAQGDRERLEKTGDYWDPGHNWRTSGPDGNIGPGGDRERRAEKLRKEQEKARKAKEEAEKKIKKLKDEIQKIKDEIYVKSGDTNAMDKDKDKSKDKENPPAESHGGDTSPPPEPRYVEPLQDFSHDREFLNEANVQTPETYHEPTGAEPSQPSSAGEPSHAQEATPPACPPEQK